MFQQERNLVRSDTMKWKEILKEDKEVEKKILREIEKEGGALGMKNLKNIADMETLKRVLAGMEKKRTIFTHKDGDIYTHNPR